jgi:aspartate aminotransferase
MRFSANVEKLKPSATIAVSTRAKELAAEGKDIINLGAGEPDFDTPGFVADAAVEGIRAGRTRYTPPPGLPELRKAIADLLSRRAGRELDWNGVMVTAGAKQALFNTVFSLFGPGDEVLVAGPYWTSYPALVELARAEPVAAMGDPADDFKVTPEILESHATERTRGLMLNTPNNPTGAVYTQGELRALAEWARDRGVWLLCDEIYRNIYHGDDREAAPGLLDLPPESLGDHVLVDGASKSYAMTGWRIGYAFTTPELTKKCSALQSQVTSNAATPSQVAALEAFSNTEEASRSIADMAAAFRRRRDLVQARFDALLPGLDYVRPHGAFYLFFRVDGLFDEKIRDATAWCAHVLEEVGVALVPGAAFGDDRWVRMSYASSDETLEEALRRLAAVVQREPVG